MELMECYYKDCSQQERLHAKHIGTLDEQNTNVHTDQEARGR